MLAFLQKVVGAVTAAAIAKGILLYLARIGFPFDVWAVDLIEGTVIELGPEAISWIMAGGFGLAALFVWNRFGWRQRPKERLAPKAAITREPLTAQRMALVEFRAEAELRGWDMSVDREGIYDAMDLVDGLNQAASDGLPMWGRLKHNGSSRGELLAEIPKTHWRDYRIEPLTFASQQDNSKTGSYQPGITTKGATSICTGTDRKH